MKTAEPEGKVLFDVGAYVGYITLGFAKLVGAEGKVLAFEPNSGNRAWLESQRNKNTSVQDRIRALFQSPCQIEMARKNLSILTVFLMEGLAGHF